MDDEVPVRNRDEYLRIVIRSVENNIKSIPSSEKTKIISLIMSSFDVGFDVGTYGKGFVKE